MPNVSDWHRKQRKKELQKNKAARIASRDEKVKSEKTEQMVMEDIRKLEKQHKNSETRPHAIQSKIDRLNKELKILKEENSKPTQAVTKTSKPPSNDPVYTPLARPELSVYYDPTLNPFGEPPPGRPRLFHRRDGGVTMNIAEAGLPGESVPPPPPPPRREAAPTSRQSAKHPFPEKKVDARRQAPTPLSQETKKETNKKIDPSSMPALPKPSAAVNRSKRKLQCDIWASNEEVEYEDATGTGLEGVVTTADTWWYLDTSSQVQGPFQLNQMKQWIQGGFFPSATKVRSSEDEIWKRISKHSVFKTLLPESMQQASNAREQQDALNHQSSVQDRIAALRQQTKSEQPASLEDRATVESSVASESESPSRTYREQESDGNEVHEEDPDEDDSVRKRIAALQAENLRNEVVENSEDSADESETSVQRRVAALRSSFGRECTDDPNNDLPAQDVRESLDNTVEQQPMYPFGAYAHQPSSHFADEMNASGPPPAFPLDNFTSHDTVANEMDEVPPAYPIDELDEMVPSYPVDIDYPATGEYPVAETYPDLGSYPIDEDEPVQPKSPSDMERPRKIVKVDKELVALMPSHLQKKRPAKAKK